MEALSCPGGLGEFGAPGLSAAKPAAGVSSSMMHSHTRIDRPSYMRLTSNLTYGEWFNFNGIVGLCDAASRVRSDPVSIHRRISPRPLSFDQRTPQQRIPAMRAGVT